MERLILDTGVLIAFERMGTNPAAFVEEVDGVALSSITVAELRLGVELADNQRRARRDTTVEAMIAEFEVLPFGTETARHYAKLLAHTRREGRPRSTHDLQIAATARATNRVLVTTDQRGFEDLPGVRLVVAGGG